jgi:WD40 repeat protein
VILFEQNMKFMRIYSGQTMRNEIDIQCPSVILAIEFIPDKNAICVSLSDRSILFYDAGSQNYKIVRKIHVPSTQKCLCYVKRKRVLFSAGADGAIFAWNMDKIFSNDFVESEAQREKEKREFDYTLYITERTPWFVGDIILCVIDLPNINFLASGSYDKLIKLWDLRGSSIEQASAAAHDHDDKASAKVSSQTFGVASKKSAVGGAGVHGDLKKKSVAGSKKAMSTKTRSVTGGQRHEEMYDDYAKEPAKILEGHTKAVREIAYSERHKILVSCGFDFEVFVWNPYCEKYIMKLDGHESPLVGVNCPSNLNAFITCDTKGMIKVWNITNYTCTQTFYVPICGSRVFKVFGYTKPFVPESSDDNAI